MLKPLVLRLRKSVSDIRVICAHHAGEAVVHPMLHDHVVRRVDDPAQDHLSRSGHSTSLDQVVAKGDEAELDP